MGWLTFFMVASLYSLSSNVSGATPAANAFLRPLFSTIIALLTLVQLKLTIRYLSKYRSHLWLYILIFGVQSFSIWAWVVLFRNLFPAIRSSDTPLFSILPIIRFGFTFLVINAFIGVSSAKLEQALHEKEETLELVEHQRNLLLEYDETTRKNLSAFLHDRVQSSLVTACLELQEISRQVDKDSQESLAFIIEKLEKLRSVDVRSASQTLSPAAGNADLLTSITTMTHEYAPAISVEFKNSDAIEKLQLESNPNLFLGIYRIIEQAFLNCAIHGKAKNFTVEISASQDFLHLTTSNDGAPLPAIQKSGLGTAIVNSWVRTLGGSWNLGNNADGRVQLSVELPRN
jgi:signal transduction histidine kinase